MNGRISDYVGSSCEVKTMENDLLLVGKIRAVLEDNGIALEIVSSDDEAMPAAAYGIPVKINIFSSKNGFLSLGGRVYITHESFWRINEIGALGENERRGYFRIKIRTQAEVMGPDKSRRIRKFKCLVTSVSLSGILIAVDDEECYFREGTQVTVNGLHVFDGGETFQVKCTVHRIDKNRSLGTLYGCCFDDMTIREANRLCREIFKQQRADIQRRRGCGS